MQLHKAQTAQQSAMAIPADLRGIIRRQGDMLGLVGASARAHTLDTYMGSKMEKDYCLEILP